MSAFERDTSSDLRAAALVAQAARLLQAATRIRRQAGYLTYHPMTGQRPHAGPALLAALIAVERVVQEINREASERATDEVAAVTAALGALRGALDSPDVAVLDAPYGRGAPARYHPGALCTMVAERVERLARSLEVGAIVKANLGREGGSIAAQSGG